MVNRPRYSTTPGAQEAGKAVLSRSFGRATPLVVHEARRQADIANAAFRLVEAQTVFWLLKSGWTQREIAAETGMSKSEVARLGKQFIDDQGNLVDGRLDVSDDLGEDVAAAVAYLWNHY